MTIKMGLGMSLYSKMISNTVLPLVLARDGRRSIIEHWREFEKSQFWNLNKLRDYQFGKLKQLLNHAYNTVPYYKNLFNRFGITPDSIKDFSDLPKLPVLTRSLIDSEYDKIFSAKFRREDLIEFGTGGTTRNAMKLNRDAKSHNLKNGAAWRFERYLGRSPADKMCSFWPQYIDYLPNQTFRAKIKSRYIFRELPFFAGAPTEEELNEYYKTLSKFKPQYIKAFPNALYRVAEYLDSKNLKLPSVQAIMSTGEALQNDHRILFDRVFGAEIFNMYGSREVGNTACECNRHEGLHIAMETSVVEIIRDGQQVDDETEGEIVITDLTNYGFPLIRYAIEDYGYKIKRACSCGRGLELMSPGVGRLMDRYIAPDGTRHSALAISATIIDEPGPPLGQIQTVQKSLTQYHMKITNNPPFNDEIKTHIEKVVRKLISPSIEITFEQVDRLPREKSGKIRYFICEVDSENR